MAASFYVRYVPPPVSSKERPDSATSKIDTKISTTSKKRKRGTDLVKVIKSIQTEDLPSVTDIPSTEVNRKNEGHQRGELDKSEDLQNQKRSLKKAKHARQTSILPSGQQSTFANGSNPSTNEDERVSSASKNEGKAKDTDKKGEPNINTKDDTKHKKIRTKFEKSSRIAAKLSKKTETSDKADAEKETGVQEPIRLHGLVPLPQPPEISDTPSGPSFSALPEWLGQPVVVSTSQQTAFDNLNLSRSIRTSLQSKGYNHAFAIQSAVLPMLLPGSASYAGDICISAATGSGKTLAYTLPMVEGLRDKPSRQLRGLIVVPTRELVTQVRGTLEICISGTGLNIGTAVGSKTLKEEQNLLVRKGQRYDPIGYQQVRKMQRDENYDPVNWDMDSIEDADDSDEFECLVDFVVEYMSNVDILICTPGRLVDHIKSTKGFTLDHVQWLVIDEADRLLDESFQEWVSIVLPALESSPKPDPRTEMLIDLFHIHRPRKVRKVILSATMTKDMSKLVPLKLRLPRLIVLENSHESEPQANDPDHIRSNINVAMDLPATLTEFAVSIPSIEEKPLYLIKAVSSEQGFMPASNIPAANLSKNKSKKHLFEDDTVSDSSSDTSSSTSSGTSDAASSSSSGIESSVSSSSKSNELRATPSDPVSSSHLHGTLIFANSNESAMRLVRLLGLLNPSLADKVGCLTKSVATSTGRKILAAFRKRKLRVLVASDRASRGLDIQDLAMVINYDMPPSLTSYIHRIGRTARAGKPGSAVTFVANHEARWFWNEIARSEQVHRSAGRKVNRVDWKSSEISEEDRNAYEVALSQLGEEVRGEK